ncbi:MAG: efflux RND transporter periplasmic adaptor subunit [Marinobacter sp.]|uniref:efflux RND transporter periplasmic adaptor subunit n=1 Tax=Marinobacter sp. TaxID=50741 RepID=UPI00299D2CF0|nr:efflux RND transporter periplasmic adaptor subunit [Marinobacter sp.]MDX1633677.1 efflux RND transporter periplasmic adaptor subunit [Marinobacter sp.]
MTAISVGRAHRGIRLGLALAWLQCAAVMAQDLPGVQLAEVVTEPVRAEADLNGSVMSLRSARLSPSVAGLVARVGVDAGDRVEAGELLMELDSELAELALASARAETREAGARLEDARRRLAEARSVGAGRNIAASEVRSRENAVATAEAALARLQAAERSQAALLERHRITAPFAGVVSARLSDVGEWVALGDELLELVDTDSLRLDFQVPQGYYPWLNKNARLLVTSATGEPTAQAEAAIEQTVPVTDSQSRTFLLRALAPEAQRWLPGMAVQARLRVETGEQGLTVPRDALNRYPDGRITVWIAEPSGDQRFKVREKRIRIGGGFGQRVVVQEGLEAGQRVVSRGNESLREGLEVRLSRREAR